MKIEENVMIKSTAGPNGDVVKIEDPENAEEGPLEIPFQSNTDSTTVEP